jgi:hypothetical protein
LEAGRVLFTALLLGTFAAGSWAAAYVRGVGLELQHLEKEIQWARDEAREYQKRVLAETI